jgi:hypothetical protein
MFVVVGAVAHNEQEQSEGIMTMMNKRNCLRVFSAAGLAVLLVSMSGCMAPMALKKNKTETLALKKPIALFSLRTKNVLKPGYQAELKSVEAVCVGQEQQVWP